MSTNINSAQMVNAATGTQTMEPIDIGFRWIDDVNIELDGGIPATELQCKIIIAGVEKKFEVQKDGNKTVRCILNERIACDKQKDVVIELHEYGRKYRVLKKKTLILSRTVSLQDDVLYTEESFRNDDDNATITLIFAYSPGGELRGQVEKARRITEEQKVVLDKLRHVHRFFQGLGKVSEAVGDMHPWIKTACTAILSLYKLCEKQKEIRDAARDLVNEIDSLLKSGMEDLGGMLVKNPTTKVAFKSLAGIIAEISKFIEEHKQGIVDGLLREAVSTSYKSKLEELQAKFRKAKESLRDSITFSTWERVIDADLRSKLESVPKAHYSPGEGCLEGTRRVLLDTVNRWIRESSEEQTAWVHGHAGSGKSALLNSIAEGLESAGIPFTCFPCKRDDPDLSNIHKILLTIAYLLSEYYGDYRGALSDVVRRPEGHSILTGHVGKQAELLFGEDYKMLLPNGCKRPSVHVILIDAFDECRNHRDEGKTATERRALLRFLQDFAKNVPWIKVLITSRPEPEIVEIFNDTTSPVHRININAGTWKTSVDIRLFIEAQSKELKLGLSSDQVEKFQVKASGLFIWCATVFRFIEESKERTDTIDDILRGQPPDPNDDPLTPLYLLYQRVLDSAVSRAQDRALMESILSVIFVSAARQPLSANAIADILYASEESERLKRKRDWVENVVRSLSAIVYVEEGKKVVRVCHPSVLDFVGRMLDGSPLETTVSSGSTLKLFSARLEEIHRCVFDGCLLIMGHDLHFNMCELENSFELNEDVLDLADRIMDNISEALQYGCSFWASHLVQSGSEESAEKTLSFLNSRGALFWAEALSLLGIVDQGVVALQDCAFFLADAPDVADIASEWEQFLLANGDALKSTPHLYLSALSWIPRSSRLWDVVHNSFSSELPIVSNVQKAWNGERWSGSIRTLVTSVAYSSDGKLLAAGDVDGSVRFWQARSGKGATDSEPFMSDSIVCSVAFPPDNRWLAPRHQPSFASGSQVWSVAFSPDNRWLSSVHGDKKVRLWDLHAESAVLRVLEGHTHLVSSVAFSSDGRRIVSGSWDKSIRVWDVESCTAIGDPFTGHGNDVTSVTFSTDDTRIISASWDNTVRVWDSETGRQIGEPLEGYCVACSRDGRFIASGSDDGEIQLWDTQTYGQSGDPLTGHTNWVRSVCFSADSKLVASCSDDRSIRIWSVDTRSLISVLRGHTDTVYSIAFSPDGRSLLSGASDCTIRVWNIKQTAITNQPSASHLAQVLCLLYVPDGSLIVSGSRDGCIFRWDAHTGAAFGQPMRGHTSAVNALAVSSDGQWIVSGSSDKTLRMWDVASGTSLGEPMLGHSNEIISVAISPDNQRIASASDDRTVRLWDVAALNLVKILEGHEDLVTSVVFSVDGNNVISGSKDETIRIWDTRTGKAVGEPLRGHSNAVLALAVSADGKWIASGSGDKSLRIWDMLTLSQVHVLESYSERSSVAFTPDNKFLIFGPHFANIIVINIQTGKAFAKVQVGYTWRIYSLSCSPNGNEFAFGTSDGSIHVWDMRACTDIELYNEDEADYSEFGEEELRVRWNASRTRTHLSWTKRGHDDGWIRGRGNWRRLLWVPTQHRDEIRDGVRLVIGAPGVDTMRPEVDYRMLFRYSETRWTDIYNVKD